MEHRCFKTWSIYLDMALNLVPFVAPLVASYAKRQLVGSGGGAAEKRQRAERDRLSGQRDLYDRDASLYRDDMMEDRGSYREASQSYRQMLEAPFASSADDTAELDRASATGVAAGERAKSNLASSMARRGITGSSATVGAETAIESSQAAMRAKSANDLAVERIRQREVRKRQLVLFLADQMARSQGSMDRSLGRSGALTQDILRGYDNDVAFNRQQQGLQDMDIQALAAEIGKLTSQGGKL